LQWRVVIELLVRRSTYLRKINRVIGFGFLAAYLALSGDFSFSPLWASGMVVGAIFFGGLLAGLRLHERFPWLDRYALARSSNLLSGGTPLSRDQWLAKKTQFTISGMQGTAILGTPGEDGFICVPVLLAGITPISAIVGGLVFGFLHLARWTILDSIFKAILYAFVCLLVLPHGLLTVVVGHVVIDVIVLKVLKLTT
jgi:hypothetical protein